MKKKLLIISITALFPLAWLFWPLSGEQATIQFDEEKVAFRTTFLAERPAQANKTHQLSNDSTKPTLNRPNIIILLADDLGKTDISLYGSPFVKTPNIDAIGHEGIIFNEGYITSPICSPSRAGLMTGRYQQRFGFELIVHDRYPKNRLEYYGFKYLMPTGEWRVADLVQYPDFDQMLKQGLPPSEIILSELLKKHGYATGITGKWHLGYNETAIPSNRGFDYQYGFYDAHTLFMADTSAPGIVNQRHPFNFSDKYIWEKGRTGNCAIRRNNLEIDDDQFLTDRIVEEAGQFITTHKDEPFFLYVPFLMPHSPFQVQQSYYDQFSHVKDRNKRVYYAMIATLDHAVGQIMARLKAEGLDDNTLVFFLSDNGGATYTHATDNAPLKGGKFTNFEGGLNVPFMMRWPGVIPAGQKSDWPVISMDIFATVCELCSLQLPQDRVYDGVDIFPYCLGGRDSAESKALKSPEINNPPHEQLCWRSGYNKAIRKGDWKLIRNEKSDLTVLYNLSVDKNETQNIAVQNPAIVKALSEDLDRWEDQMLDPAWPQVMDFRFLDGEVIHWFPL